MKPLAGATTARQPYQRYDTIEDTETTRSDIEAEFGPAIAAVVAEVTDDKSLPDVRDVASSPRPLIGRSSGNTNTSIGRAVVERMRGTHEVLEGLFHDAYGARP